MAAKIITMQGFMRFNADSAKYGAENPFHWVPGCPEMYTQEYTENFIADAPISFELPEGFHPTASLVKAIEREREEVKREFSKRVMELDAQIGKLLAIEGAA